MAYRNYATANGHIVDPAGNGDYTTIQAAITAASSGQTIFIRPGTYTENLTLKAGVSLTAFGCDSSANGTGNVIIRGKATFTGIGTVTIANIQLQTNSDFFLAVTGSSASVVNLVGCYLNCLNNTGISFTSSNASSSVNVYNSTGNLGTTGIAYFSHSSTGTLLFNSCNLSNSGSSVTASTASAGVLNIYLCTFVNAITTSGTSSTVFNYVNFSLITNTTSLTIGGSGSNFINYSVISGGTASAINIVSSLEMSYSIITSSNTNAMTGAGTVQYFACIFPTSFISNTTIMSGGAATGLTNGISPSSGQIGEQIRATVASASAQALSNLSPLNVTSINLTAGVWDVSGIISFKTSINPTITFTQGSISTTSATPGTEGDNTVVSPTAPNTNSGTFLSIPSYRLTLSTTTTVYLVANCGISVGNISAFGRISATRVG